MSLRTVAFNQKLKEAKNLLCGKKHIHPKSACIFRGTYCRPSSLNLNSGDDSKFGAERDRTAQARVQVLGHHVSRQGSQLWTSHET